MGDALFAAVAGFGTGLSLIVATGAACASLCWFAALGFGARLLTGFFARPSSWRVLDGLVAAIGVSLVAGAS